MGVSGKVRKSRPVRRGMCSLTLVSPLLVSRVASLALNTLSVYKIVIDKGPTTLCVRLAENDGNFERERGWSLESRGGVSAGRDREISK